MKAAESFLSRQIENNKTPGLQYIFFNQDSILYSYCGGKANFKNDKKIDNQTTFNAYSVTKTFTGLAILQLAEKGLLKLDHPVYDYLPGFPYSHEVTVRQLLTHSSGIPNPLPLSWIHLPEESQSFDRNAFFDKIFLIHNKTKTAPNEKFAYSNLGYVLLGQIIEQITEQSYEEYIRRNVLNPISINKSDLDFVINDADLHATGHQKRFSLLNAMLGILMKKSSYKDKSTGLWTAIKNTYVNGAQYGGLIGNAGGFVIYLQELLKPNNRLISDDYKGILFKENVLENGKVSDMCISWFKGELNGQTYFAHAGGGFYYCEIRLYPDSGMGSVIMFNRSGMTDVRFLDKIDTYFLEK